MGQAWASLQETLQGRHWKERQVRKITDKVFDRLTEDAPKREKEALKFEEVYIAVLCVYNDINKYLPGPHYDPPSKERLKELMISMMGAAYGMAMGVASMGVTACAVTFTVGGLGAINTVAGAFSENLPVICIVGGPNSNDYGSNRILHHTIGIPDFTQELRCFQNVTCYQDPELWKKKNIPVGDVRSFCLIIQRQRWLLLEASSSVWLSWL